MHIYLKMAESVRQNIFGDKKTTNKVPLMLLHATVLTER